MAGVIFGVDILGVDVFGVDVLSGAFDVDLLCGGYLFGIYGFGLRGGIIMLCHVLPFEVNARSDSLYARPSGPT